MLRVAAFVSGGGTNLQAIIDAQTAGTIRDAKVELVISNVSTAYALERAKNAGIKTVLVPKKNEKDIEEISAEIKRGIEIVFVENMEQVIEQAFVK